jgi:hypothetical protein
MAIHEPAIFSTATFASFDFQRMLRGLGPEQRQQLERQIPRAEAFEAKLRGEYEPGHESRAHTPAQTVANSPRPRQEAREYEATFTAALTDEERTICRLTGVSEKDFVDTRNRLAAERLLASSGSAAYGCSDEQLEINRQLGLVSR